MSYSRMRARGFIILKSSLNHYHVVFNRKVSWTENMKIVAWVSLLSHNRMLRKWFEMQCIKEGSTLRVSPKRKKPSPRIVFRYGRQDDPIRDFARAQHSLSRDRVPPRSTVQRS